MAEGPQRTVKIIQSSAATALPERAREAPEPGQVPPSAFGNLGGLTFHYSPKDARASGDCDVVMSQSVYRQVLTHLSHDTSREHGGLLLGFELGGGNTPATVIVTHSLPARHTDGSPTRLDIKADSWAEWDRITDDYARNGLILRRVGWYHSHPNIDIFLSKWDLDVCQEFKRPTQVAMVVDPIGKRGGFFVRGSKGFRTNAPQSFWEMHDLSSGSLVEWTNVKTIDLRAGLPKPDSPAEKVEPAVTVEPAVRVEPAATVEPAVSKAPAKSAPTTMPEPQPAPAIRPSPESTIKPILWALVVLTSGSLALQAWSTWMLRGAAGHSAATSPNPAASQPAVPSEPAASPPPGASSAGGVAPAVAAPVIQVAINPAQALLKQSETKKFTAKVTGNPNQKVIWSISPRDVGSINEAGTYKAPSSIPEARDITVTATSKADPGQSASAIVSLAPSTPPPQTNSGTRPPNPQPSNPQPPAAPVSVSVSPSEATLKASESKQFTQTVTGSNDSSVDWSIDPPNAGSIDAQGKYQSPAEVTGPLEVKVTARSKADSSKSGQAVVKLTPQ